MAITPELATAPEPEHEPKPQDGDVEPAGPSTEDDTTAEPLPEYPTGVRFALILFALCLVGFLISLDSTVVATAVPVISDEFRSLEDIGWYSSVYFLAMCLPQLSLMELYDRYPIRWTYTAAIAIFLAGSALCGGAPNSAALVAGRAVAGLGAAGLYAGNNALVPYLAPAEGRPVFFGLFLGAMGLGLGSGPLIGGVFTQQVTWRWNFYINLPIGGFIYAIFFFFVRPRPPPGTVQVRSPWPVFIRSLDLPGLVLLTPAVLSLLLALQWGGSRYPWNSGRIKALLVLAGILGLAFIANEAWQGPHAMLPSRLLLQRNVACAVWFCFCSNAATAVLNYYLPIWFQGVRGASPISSGVDTLPIVIMTGVSSIVGGIYMTIWGHVGPSMLFGAATSAIGAGLLTTLNLRTSTGKWIGYQILCGIGCAAGRLCPSVALQNILDPADVAYGYTLLTFMASMGGAVFVSVAQALFTNYLRHGLEALGVPADSIGAALAGGVNTIASGLSGDEKVAVLSAINKALTRVWTLAVVLASLGVIGAVAIQYSKIQSKSRRA